MGLNEMAIQHSIWLKDMGWWKNKTPLESIALIASEIGEAANECRGETPNDNLRFELADIILRTIGLAAELDYDIEEAIKEKLVKNSHRGKIGRIK